MKVSWLAAPIAIAGIFAVGLTAVASADPSPSPSRSPGASAGDQDKAHAKANKDRPDKQGRAGGRLLKHALHGEFTVGTRNGSETRVEVIQRGEITKVDTKANTLTMKSADGFTRTYTVTDDTRIRSKREAEEFTDLKAGERAMVLAEKTGSTYRAKVIRCVREPKDQAAKSS